MAKLNNLDQTIRTARTRAGDRSGARTMAAILAILFLGLLVLFIQQLITPVPVGAAVRPTATRITRTPRTIPAPTMPACTPKSTQTIMEGVVRITCAEGGTIITKTTNKPRPPQRATLTPAIQFGP